MGLRNLFGFYKVEYQTRKGLFKSIVRAVSEKEAKQKFYDPEDEFGPKYEIKFVSKVHKIPKGWELVLSTQNNGLLITKSKSEITDSTVDFCAGYNEDGMNFNISQLLCANPPRKEHIL